MEFDNWTDLPNGNAGNVLSNDAFWDRLISKWGFLTVKTASSCKLGSWCWSATRIGLGDSKLLMKCRPSLKLKFFIFNPSSKADITYLLGNDSSFSIGHIGLIMLFL